MANKSKRGKVKNCNPTPTSISHLLNISANKVINYDICNTRESALNYALRGPKTFLRI